MIKTVMFGAGQMGAILRRLIGPKHEVVCFADNSPKKWGTRYLDLPVLSPADSLRQSPELVCLCVLDSDRSDAMEAQLRSLGYDGAIIRPDALKIFDARAATMRLLAEQIRKNEIAGDTAELGVYRGDFAALINAAFPDRTLHLYDTFTGFPAEDIELEAQKSYSKANTGDFSDTGVVLVQAKLPFPEKARFYMGYFPQTFLPEENTHYAFVSIDADLYAPTAAALPLFWERLSDGGALMIHDVNSTQYCGVSEAVREFCREKNLLPMPVCDLHGSVVLRKQL